MLYNILMFLLIILTSIIIEKLSPGLLRALIVDFIRFIGKILKVIVLLGIGVGTILYAYDLYEITQREERYNTVGVDIY